MLWAIIILLVVVWLIFKLLAFTLGGLLHLVLILAVILLVVKIVKNLRSK